MKETELKCPVCGGKVVPSEDESKYDCLECYCTLTLMDGELKLQGD